MILIAIDQKDGQFTLTSANTHIGSVYSLSGATLDEVMLRFLPVLRAWGDLEASGDLDKRPYIGFGPEPDP